MSTLLTEDLTFEARYRRALTVYLDQEANESELMTALELGRAALAEERGLLDLLAMHHAQVAVLTRQLGSSDIRSWLARANEFLIQVAAPFEMAHLGWHEMADRLRLANEVLEKRVAERTAAHRQAEERLDRAQQVAGIGSWELDLETGLQMWSKQMYRICGLPDRSSVPSVFGIGAFIDDDDRERHETWFGELAAGRDPGPIEYRIRRPDGERRIVSADGEAVAAADGTVIRVSCTLQDITERKAAETQFHELQAELAHISRVSTIGHMASALAHEINQPLSAIANYLKGAHRLLNGRSDELSLMLRPALDQAGEQATRAGQIVRRLRDFMSRRETEFRIESVRKLIEETSALALVGTKDEGVSVTIGFHTNVDLVLIDKIQVQQVLLNLLRNAAEAMQATDQRRLSVSTAIAEDDMVLISVIDSGPGIAEEVAARLFQPFVTSKQHGMGVGLSISRTIIESHGGQIWFEPNPDGGTIFRFTLRAVTAEELGEAERTVPLSP
jgi:PAS domain S-box-containing protein